MIDSSQRGVRGARDGGARDGGAGGAVVDEGGLAVAWQNFAVRRQSRQATKHQLYHSWWYYRCSTVGVMAMPYLLRTSVQLGCCGVRRRYLSVS